MRGHRGGFRLRCYLHPWALANLSILKNNKAKAIRFSTLEALCKALDCRVEDIIEYRED